MDTKLYSIFYMVFFAVIGLTSLVLVVWSITTEKRLKKFFSGKKAKDLEDHVLDLEVKIVELEKARAEIQNDIVLVNKKLKKSIRGLETLRFNPFPDQGSNQSFAIGLLDEEGDGVVLSSLYSRERMSVFAKPVKNQKSEYELTAEEKEVLKKAEVK